MDRRLSLDSRATRRPVLKAGLVAVTTGLLVARDAVSIDLSGILGTSNYSIDGDNGSGGYGLSVVKRNGLFPVRTANAAPLESCARDDNDNASGTSLDNCPLTATLEARAFWIDPNKTMGKQITTGLGGRIMLVTHAQDGYLFRTAEQDCTDGTGFVIAGPFNLSDSDAYKAAIKRALEARPTSGETSISIGARPETHGRFYNDSTGAWENGVPLINLGFKRVSSESGEVLWTDPDPKHARLCIAGETVRSLLYQARSIDKVYAGHNGVNPNRPYVENHKMS